MKKTQIQVLMADAQPFDVDLILASLARAASPDGARVLLAPVDTEASDQLLTSGTGGGLSTTPEVRRRWPLGRRFSVLWISLREPPRMLGTLDCREQ